ERAAARMASVGERSPSPKRRNAQNVVHSAPASILPPTEPKPLMLSVMDIRDGQCRYPHGDYWSQKTPLAFCGHSVVRIPHLKDDGTSDLRPSVYCKFHHLACYQTR